MKFSAGGSALGLSLFIVCSGEEGFESSTSFLLNGQTFPGFAVVYKNAGLVYKLEGDANDLFKAVWNVVGDGVISAVFDPVEEGFDWLIDVVRGAEDRVVFL